MTTPPEGGLPGWGETPLPAQPLPPQPPQVPPSMGSMGPAGPMPYQYGPMGSPGLQPPPPPPPVKSSKGPWIFVAVLVVGLVVAVGVGIALLVGQSDAPERAAVVESPSEPRKPSGPRTSAPRDRSGSSPGTTQPAHYLEGTDLLTGSSVGLSLTDGKPTLVVFWAHWCPHCQKELPIVQELYEDHGDTYGFLTVATAIRPGSGGDGYGSPEEFVDTVGLTMPVIVDEDGVLSQAWAIEGFPQMFVVDSSGNIVSKVSGEQGEERILAMLEDAS